MRSCSKMGKGKWYTLETACVFGTCVFIVDILCKLWALIFSVAVIAFTWHKYGNLVVRAQVVISFFAAVYCTFSFILAYFLFRGLHSKLPGVIKLGAIFVVVLRLWECAAALVSWDESGSARDEFGVYRASKIGSFIVINLAYATFVVILFLHYRTLVTPTKRRHHHKGNKASRNSNSTSTLSV